ncbi:MAG: AI-2E family transporter [Methylococcales bacterium]|nr:AI-2E family transporter [Methylococcales bacterium]
MLPSNFRFEKIASLSALVILLFACYQVLQPFVFDLLWAAILCYVTWPWYAKLRSLQLSPDWAATCMVVPISILLLAPFVAAAFSFTDDIHHMLHWLNESAHNWPPAPAWLHKLPLVGEYAGQSWAKFGEDSTRLVTLGRQYALSISGWLLDQSITVGSGLVHMGLSLLVLYFFYRDGEEVAQHVVIAIQRLAGEQTQRILHIIRSSLRAVVYGILGTALIQALASIMGLMIAGVPYAFVLGVISFFLMIIPNAGTLLWLPISVWMLVEGETGWAIFIAVWFSLFVGTIDNWLRPILISREVELPFILIVFGIFGGLLAFGFIGVFIGPTLLATSYALILDWLIRKEQESGAEA